METMRIDEDGLMEAGARCDRACAILRRTNDGEDLAPWQLKLVENAVNGFLNKEGRKEFERLYVEVESGAYKKPWYFGIEHMTINHSGYVFWRGACVEHYSYKDQEMAKIAALRLAEICRELERRGVNPDTSAVWNFRDQNGLD